MANYVLEILDGDRAGEVLTVADRAVRVGRKPGNDLVLADEKTSGVHAEIVPEGDRHVLRDLGSTNGTFLDGKRVTELVLTPGDVVTFGRLRVKFRRDGEAAAAATESGDLAVRHLDAGRLQRRGGSVGLLAAVAVLGAGAAGWFWWQGRTATADPSVGPAVAKTPLVVNDNRLAAALAGCENEEGWQLRAAGAPFQPSGRAHTGSGSFAATRDAAEAPDFAMLSLQAPLPVFAGRTLTLAAHVRCEAGGQVALRALLASANEQVPFQFRTGTAFAAADGWQRLETTIGVPVGCDRLQVEVVALLTAVGAEVLVDDVAVTEGGGAAPLEAKLPETNQTALGTGAALAVRSVDTEQPAILLQVLPDAVPPALQALHRADLGALSDVGGSLQCTPSERGFQVQVSGAAAVTLVFPADAAGGLLVDGGSGFASTAAESEFSARTVLLGDRLTRVAVQLEAPAACRGRSERGRYRLSMPVSRFDLGLGFRAELQQAGELLRQASRSQQEGRPGEALDKLGQLLRTVPMDTEVLAQALTLRGEVMAAQAETFRALQRDLDEASFFTTRGGFERVVAGVDDLVALYGQQHLEDAAAASKLRDAARAQLQAIDDAERSTQRARLADLAKAFAAAEQPQLSQLVQRYVDRHLPAGGDPAGAPKNEGK